MGVNCTSRSSCRAARSDRWWRAGPPHSRTDPPAPAAGPVPPLGRAEPAAPWGCSTNTRSAFSGTPSPRVRVRGGLPTQDACQPGSRFSTRPYAPNQTCPAPNRAPSAGPGTAGTTTRQLPGRHRAEPRSGRLIRLCAMLPDHVAAPALTVLASVSWWRGNGALMPGRPRPGPALRPRPPARARAGADGRATGQWRLSPDDGTHQDVVLDQFVLVCRARGDRCESAGQLSGRQFTQGRHRFEIEAVRIGLRVAEHHHAQRR